MVVASFQGERSWPKEEEEEEEEGRDTRRGIIVGFLEPKHCNGVSDTHRQRKRKTKTEHALFAIRSRMSGGGALQYVYVGESVKMADKWDDE